MLSGRFFLLLLTTLLLTFQSRGQSDAFRPFSNVKGWAYVSSEYFDVYYVGDQQAAANKVARYAELARYELGVLYDYKPAVRYTLIYSNDPLDFLSNNLSLTEPAAMPGVFSLPRMEAYVFHPGNNQALYQAVKYEVSQLVLREFSYGEGLGASIQRQVLFSNPEWFSQGLSEYVAAGWTYEDEMWISNIKTDGLVALALEGDEYANLVVRKSVWRYIAHEYGEQKLSEIIYLVNISHSIESGVISVLGITLPTLTSRWREHINTRTSTRAASRLALKDIPDIEQIAPPSGQQIAGFAYNEVHNLFALYLNRQGSQTVEFFDPKTQKFTPSPIQSGIGSLEAIGLDFRYPMAWSLDGSTLATTFYKNRQYFLVYYDLESKAVTALPIDPSIDRILSLNWSHDGQRIVLSALHSGRTDIFTTRAGEADFRALTNDPFDNLDPVWSMDDQAIFFASNRDTNALNLPQARWESYRNDFDLYKYDRTSGADTLEQLTFSPTINERQPYALSSFELGYISDEFGVRNLHKINVFLKETEPVSNLNTGIDRLQASEKWVAFLAPLDGLNTVFLAPTRNLQSVRTPEPTLLRLEYLAAYRDRLAREAALDAREAGKNLPQTAPEKGIAEPEAADEATKNERENADEGKPEKGNKKPIRYYIFDEDDEPYELARPDNIVFGVTEPGKSATNTNIFGDTRPPSLAAFIVSDKSEARNVWSADYVGLGVVYDYVPRYGMEFNIGFSDLLKNHRIDATIRPYFNLKNADARVRYTYQQKRLDLWAEGSYQTRLYRPTNENVTIDTLTFRYETARLRIGATYPLSTYLALEGSASIYNITQQDLHLRRPTLRDASDRILSATVGFRYDKTQQKQGFFTRGLAASMFIESAYALGKADFAFHTARLQLRHYLPVHKQIVLATQINSSVSIAPDRQQYYMGGVDNWVLGVFFDESGQRITGNDLNSDLYKFGFQDFITPVRGFSFNSRRGSKYVLMNSELRIPLARLLKQSLHSGALYGLELIPFIDAGTVWDQGNPFSQKNPTDTQIIGSPPVTVLLQTLKSPFIFGFGSGVRTNIVGYSLRVDLAWGIDDNSIKEPVLSLSLARNF